MASKSERSCRTSASSIFLHKGRKTYYHRSLVPKRLRTLLAGRGQIWRSLKTEDPEEAAVRSLHWDVRVQRLFFELKRNGDHMNTAQIEALVSHWLERELEEAEDYRAVVGSVTDEYRDDVSLILSDQLQDAFKALVSCDYRTIEKEADELLAASGLPALDHKGAQFGRLCRRFLIAKQKYLRIESERWEGDYTEVGFDRPEVPGEPGERRTSQRPTGGTPSRSELRRGDSEGRQHGPAHAFALEGSGPLFSDAIQKYLIDNPRAPRSIEPWTNELKTFLEVIGGDRPIDRITKADCRLYKERMLNDRKLNFSTVAKHLSGLSGIFRWAEAQGYLPDDAPNPVRGLAPANKHVKRQRLHRRPFTDQELLQVCSAKKFLIQRTKHPERYWVILLCLFQLCRRDEAAQLMVEDIVEVDGLPCMRITDTGPDQHLKNEGSKRTIPLHSSLVSLGFMEYVIAARKQRWLQLFPALKYGPHGFGDRVGRFFGELVTRVGLADPALTLHSMRHGGITKLHEAGCPVNIVQMLAGHVSGDVHGRYVHRDKIAMRVLQEGLERLRYDEILKVLTA
jgi:integrase